MKTSCVKAYSFRPICQTTFTSKVRAVYPENSASAELKDKIDDFEERTYAYSKLGEGKCSAVYALTPNELVIKKAIKTYNDSSNVSVFFCV